ncbi:hypothetical protein F2Q68_00011255 [Brassica cretica]|uniref:Uncharacterized protein n=1 Tax=Brassica cretica TaxID=69181 RepID=A0A8S9KRF3_BRACR|nr:hypothetical protein F2Q68_00011255 [Brassica cretica]
MASASSGAVSGGFYRRLDGGNALAHHNLNDHHNSGFSPIPGYNLNISSSENSRDYVQQTSDPNFLIQCSSSQRMLTVPNNNDQSFMNEQGMIQFDPVNNTNLKSNTNNSFFNLGFFQENTKNSETSLPSLYSTDVHTRGLASSSNSSSVVGNDFGGGQIMGNNNNGSLQGLMSSLVAVNGGGAAGSGGNIFDVHFGNIENMSGSDKLTLDFLGVGGLVRNVNRGGGHGDVPEQNHTFGRP